MTRLPQLLPVARYSPSGCKYSYLDQDTFLDDDDNAENGNNSCIEEGEGRCGDDGNITEPAISSSSFPASSCSRKMLLSVAVATTACMRLAYLAGSHSYSYNNSSASPLHVPPGVDAGTGPYKNGRTHPKVFVCITGQLPRLELTNKITNLFQPWHRQHNVEFDVALVLTDTNHRSVRRVERRDREYDSVQQVHDELSALEGVTVLNGNLDLQSQNPILNPRYTEQRGRDTTMTPGQVLERVQNHVRQFESLVQCHHHLSAQGTARPSDYDMVHRIREDSGYYRPPDFGHIHDAVSAFPMTVLSSDCNTHGGINDRGSFVSSDAAYDFFVRPLVDMYTRPLPRDVRKTEQFLMVTYARTCRLVQTNSFQIFRLWEKVDDDDVGGGDDNHGSDGTRTGDGGVGTYHISETEFSRSDLVCLEKRGESTVKPHKSHRPFCHSYSDGFDYCIFKDYGLYAESYDPGKTGLLLVDDDDGISARPREDWVPEMQDEGDGSSADGGAFDALTIGWDALASNQVDQVVNLKTDEQIIAEKKAERKKKRKDWKERHRDP